MKFCARLGVGAPWLPQAPASTSAELINCSDCIRLTRCDLTKWVQMNRPWMTSSWLVGNSIQIYGTVLSEETSYVFVKLNFRESSVSWGEMLGRAAIDEERTGAPVCLLCVIPEIPGAEFLLCTAASESSQAAQEKGGCPGQSIHTGGHSLPASAVWDHQNVGAKSSGH